MTRVNEELRAHVTRVGFDLSLGKLHVFWLVAVAEQERSTWRTTPAYKWYSEQFIKGYQGLYGRGLLRQSFDENGRPTGHELTTAGEAVVVLLKECGLYQEQVKAFRRKRTVA